MKKSALFLLAAGLAAAFAAEAYCRRAVRLDALVYQDSLDPALGFELRPGSEGMKEGAWVRINADGLRERDVPRAKPADEFRVVVVGDEPTFGLGLGERDLFVRRLEGLLKPPAGKRLVTVNVSMYHYNLPQEVELLRERALAYQPDVVVLESSADQPTLPKVAFPYPRLKNFLRARSVLARWAMERSYWSRPAARGTFEVASIETGLGDAAAALKEARVPGLVVFFPDMRPAAGQDAERERVQRDAFRGVSSRLGLPYYDAGAALPSAGWKRFLISPDRSWPNAEAEKALAAGMAPALQKLVTPAPRKTRPAA